MAAKIPAIITDAPGCIDTVKDNHDGLIIPVKSPKIIAEKIRQLEKNSELKDNVIKNGYMKAQQQDWDHIAEKYLKIYQSLIN